MPFDLRDGPTQVGRTRLAADSAAHVIACCLDRGVASGVNFAEMGRQGCYAPTETAGDRRRREWSFLAVSLWATVRPESYSPPAGTAA
jgi:hypothetical protein